MFIEYLEPGHYLGIDKQPELIREGREQEVGEALWQAKQPEVFASDAFEFERFSRPPDFAIAQSLFTHLDRSDIKRCLRNLAQIAPPHCRLYATFFEAERKTWNLLRSHSSRRFDYTPEQMRAMGAPSGWQMEYVGDWGHPRNQRLVIYNRSS